MIDIRKSFFQIKYNLGNATQTESAEKATEVFLRREFPQFLESKTKPHDSVMIPDSFIYGGIAAKVFGHFYKVGRLLSGNRVPVDSSSKSMDLSQVVNHNFGI
jgi:hypothetical protein